MTARVLRCACVQYRRERKFVSFPDSHDQATEKRVSDPFRSGISASHGCGGPNPNFWICFEIKTK